ncbi:MAG: PqqD family protein [Polyangiales bacterium]
MNSDVILRHSPDVAWRRIDGLVAIISLEANRVRLLNRVGSFLWERCDGSTPEALVGDTCARFEVAESTARRDIDAVVRDLVSRGLITTSPSGMA